VIRESGRAGYLDTVELWIRFINIRNIAVHDYNGISPHEYLDTIKLFLPEARKII